MSEDAGDGIVALTAGIVSAYAAHNRVQAVELVALIGSVHAALVGLGKEPVPVVEERVPAVPIRKSITPDHLVCLEDGKKFKSLRRHLRSAFDMSPEDYRSKWGLPPDYPMVAPNYAEARSRLARTIGLGSLRRKGGPPAPEAEAAAPKRGRKPKASVTA